MAYYIDLFSPDTYEAFRNSDKTISGFRERQRSVASDVKVGDKLICYITKLSRWVGILEVKSKYFEDDKPIFHPVNDPFTIRFNVAEKVWLPIEHSIPIYQDIVWNHLSFTKPHSKNSSNWTGIIRGSLRQLDDFDGEFLEKLLLKQSKTPVNFPLSDAEQRKLKAPVVKTQDSKQVSVVIPINEEVQSPHTGQASLRESLKIQALIAEIGEKMNFKVWLPCSDKQRIFEMWTPKKDCLLEILPMNYGDATMKTIENIDVLWIKGRSIIRAFEIEHTTSIYSGILRMADLMALQPNLKISAHIVAPEERKEKVLQEISRPVFAFLESGPLTESCSFLSYNSIQALYQEKQLKHMSDSVLEEYAEYAEEADI